MAKKKTAAIEIRKDWFYFIRSEDLAFSFPLALGSFQSLALSVCGEVLHTWGCGWVTLCSTGSWLLWEHWSVTSTVTLRRRLQFCSILGWEGRIQGNSQGHTWSCRKVWVYAFSMGLKNRPLGGGKGARNHLVLTFSF